MIVKVCCNQINVPNNAQISFALLSLALGINIMNLDDCEKFFAKLYQACPNQFFYAIESLFGNYEILLLEFGRDSIFADS